MPGPADTPDIGDEYIATTRREQTCCAIERRAQVRLAERGFDVLFEFVRRNLHLQSSLVLWSADAPVISHSR